MSTAISPLTMDFAFPGVPAAWANSLPSFSATLRGSFSVWRCTVFLYRHTARVRRDLDRFFTVMTPEDKHEYAEMMLRHAALLREGFDRLLPYRSLGLIPRISIDWHQKALVDFSDLVEVVALAADPDMSALGQRLEDVL